jgi:hypothetical protein
MKLEVVNGKQKGVTVWFTDKDKLFLPAYQICGVRRFKKYVRIWTIGVTISVDMDTEQEAHRTACLIRKELRK